MIRCQASPCDRFALWEVRGWPDIGESTLMCSFHAEVFMDDDLRALLHSLKKPTPRAQESVRA